MEYSIFTCRHCGNTFKVQTARVGNGHYGKYCSRSCHQAKVAARVTYTCKACGAEFEGYKSSRSSFCTRECYRTHRQVAKVCVTCGVAFSVSRGQAHRYNNCSEACRTAGMGDHKCRRCGKRFRARTSSNPVYCSEECYRPPHYAKCDNCDRRYRIVPSSVGIRRFCSFSCWRKFTGETRLEAAVRVALEEMGLPFEQEKQVGRYSIDFALLFFGVALEVDGAYWHQNTSRDKRKERALAKAGWQVVRLAEADVEASRNLPRLIQRRLREAAQA